MTISTYQYKIRLPKQHSAFFYFQLEANEGLCFYSTLPGHQGLSYREILVEGDKRLEPEFLKILESLKEKCEIEVFNQPN